MFYKNSSFQFAEILESNWLLIKEELTNLQQGKFIPCPEKFLYDRGWDVFGLYALLFKYYSTRGFTTGNGSVKGKYVY